MGEAIKVHLPITAILIALSLFPFLAKGIGMDACYPAVVPNVKIANESAARPLHGILFSLTAKIFPNLSLEERQELNQQIDKRVVNQLAASRKLGFFDRADRGQKWEADTIEVVSYPDQVIDGKNAGNFRTLNLAYSKLQSDLTRLATKAFKIAAHVLPFFPSPLFDGGYDVANYYSVRKSLGGLKAYDAFAQYEGGGLVGRNIVVDLIANHRSEKSPEFQRALKGDRAALNLFVHTFSKPIEEETFYRDGVPFKNYLIKGKYGVYKRMEARLNFAGIVDNHWQKATLPDGTEVYFFSQFLLSQKDLNWENPAVLLDHIDVADFWVNRGASTLRLDAIPFLDKRSENSPRTLAIVEFLQAYLDAVAPHVVLRNEAAVQARELARLSGENITGPHPITGETRTRTERARSNYYFPIIPNAFASFFSGQKKYAEEAITDLKEIDDPSTLNFPTRTHDEVTLETASPEVANINRGHLLFETHNGQRRGQKFRGDNDETAAGISGSTAAFFDFNANRILSYFAFYLSLPGQISFQMRDLYAMGNDWDLALRKQAETGGYDSRWGNRGGIPMASLNGGMTPLQHEVYFGAVRMMAIRMNLGDVMRRGKTHLIPNSSPNVTTFLKTHGRERLLVIKNFSNRPTTVTLSGAQLGMARSRDALTGHEYDLSLKEISFHLEGDQTIWLSQ